MQVVTGVETSTREAISFCRLCGGGCGMRMVIDENDRIVSIRGDQDNPLTKGYACFKGLQAEEAHHGPGRILHPLKRLADGGFERISIEQALDEIAAKLAPLIAEHGPQSLALFLGNGGFFASTVQGIHRTFLDAIGTSQYYTTITIDQSAKMVCAGRLGIWGGGYPQFEKMDVALVFGANPLVSHALPVMLAADPVRSLKRAHQNGLKLITIDPRRTETAHFAAIALQPLPGHDAAIAAALLRIILAEGWEDMAFCAQYVGAERMARLRAEIERFDPAEVERTAGLSEGDLLKVAAMFARDGKVGIAASATGTNMAPFSNLAVHLIECLNVVCGRYAHAGDPIHVVDMFEPPVERRAQVIPAPRVWEKFPPSRIRGAGNFFGERLSGTLADEILNPGEGQVRALIVDGANPALSFPDQKHVVKALKSLDLLITIEPWMTPTAKLSHYILPPNMQYEREDFSFTVPGVNLWPGAWAQYTPAILRPPVGSEVAHSWYYYWGLAKRLGLPLHYDGQFPMDFEKAPTNEELIALRLSNAQTSLEELKKYPHGRDFPIDGAILEAEPGADALFDVMPDDVAGEVDRLIRKYEAAKQNGGKKRFSHLLSVRRNRDTFNSNGPQLKAIRRRTPYNPAYLNSAEAKNMGVVEGDIVEISSAHGTARAVAQIDEALRPGVVSITHGWGDLPSEEENAEASEVCVNLLIDTNVNYEDINAMPHMSAVPVNIRRLS